jgi:hypothetical protein
VQAVEAGGQLMLERYFVPVQLMVWLAMVLLLCTYMAT